MVEAVEHCAQGPVRYFSLDVLRGVAILLVLLRHLPATDVALDGAAEDVLRWLGRVGWAGVDLFFVLSGFLISGLVYAEYDRTNRFDSRRFWLRRGMKIWPAYFAAYGVATLLRIVWQAIQGHAGEAQRIATQAWCNVVFVQNYVACESWPHSWSLAVEEHFYTLFAIILGLAGFASARAVPGARAFRAVVPVFAGVAIAALALRYRACVMDGARGGFEAYYRSHLRFDALAFGVAAGYLLRYHRERLPPFLFRWPSVSIALGVAFAAAKFLPLDFLPLGPSLGLTLTYLGFGVAVAAAGMRPAFGAAGAFARPLGALARLGVYSYTVYLVHSVVFLTPGAETARIAMARAIEASFGAHVAAWAVRATFLAVSIGGGVALSHLVERPFLRLRERWLPTRSGTAAVA